jgi:hypothetical protein
MIINHLNSGALLSMPLPLSIFLWATLSPRPSRNYWITVLTYTEAMIVVKYIFQFRFYPWNSGTADPRPLGAINIIGIDRKANAASVADLYLLLSLFLHRSILKVKNFRNDRIYYFYIFVLATWTLEIGDHQTHRYIEPFSPIEFRLMNLNI